MKRKFRFVIMCGLIFILIGTLITGAAYAYGRKNYAYANNGGAADTYAQNFDINAVKSIKIHEVTANIYIEKGNRFSVVAENVQKDILQCELIQGVLTIRYKEQGGWFNIGFIKFPLKDITNPTLFWGWNDSPKIYIYIPEGKIFDELLIEDNLGNIKVDKILCNNLNILSNVGNVTADNFNTTSLILKDGLGNADLTGTVSGNDNINISGRVGNTELELSEPVFCGIDIKGGLGNISINAKLNGNADIKGGVGNIKWNGAIYGDLRIDGGLGEIIFDLAGNIDDYNIRASGELGDIRINGVKNSKDYNKSTIGAKYNFNIEGGVGDVKLNIK